MDVVMLMHECIGYSCLLMIQTAAVSKKPLSKVATIVMFSILDAHTHLQVQLANEENAFFGGISQVSGQQEC